MVADRYIINEQLEPPVPTYRYIGSSYLASLARFNTAPSVICHGLEIHSPLL